jgi:glutamine amidotransferase-like uncharacterized protein
MRNIYVYNGKGAYQAKDIENFLSVFDFYYKRICEHNLKEMKSKSIFIVPGGLIDDYLPAWGKMGINIIRNFVKEGGIYMGICSGVYVAGKKYKKQNGLNFFQESLNYIKREEIVSVKDNKGKSFNLITENGPDLSLIKNGKVLLKDKKGIPYAIKINFGKGKVYLFSSHPEGSVYYKKLPQNFSGARYLLSLLKKI